jgi:small subunit ribosomal protein S20
LAGKKTSAEKRHEQSERRRLRNKAAKSAARTYARKYVEAVHSKNQEMASDALRTLVKTLDTAAGKRILSKNAVARKKSRMMKLFNVSFAREKTGTGGAGEEAASA